MGTEKRGGGRTDGIYQDCTGASSIFICIELTSNPCYTHIMLKTCTMYRVHHYKMCKASKENDKYSMITRALIPLRFKFPMVLIVLISLSLYFPYIWNFTNALQLLWYITSSNNLSSALYTEISFSIISRGVWGGGSCWKKFYVRLKSYVFNHSQNSFYWKAK